MIQLSYWVFNMHLIWGYRNTSSSSSSLLLVVVVVVVVAVVLRYIIVFVFTVTKYSYYIKICWQLPVTMTNMPCMTCEQISLIPRIGFSPQNVCVCTSSTHRLTGEDLMQVTWYQCFQERGDYWYIHRV